MMHLTKKFLIRDKNPFLRKNSKKKKLIGSSKRKMRNFRKLIERAKLTSTRMHQKLLVLCNLTRMPLISRLRNTIPTTCQLMLLKLIIQVQAKVVRTITRLDKDHHEMLQRQMHNLSSLQSKNKSME
jgi:hypothetical protein